MPNDRIPWFSYMMFALHVQLCAPHDALYNGDFESISHAPVAKIRSANYKIQNKLLKSTSTKRGILKLN